MEEFNIKTIYEEIERLNGLINNCSQARTTLENIYNSKIDKLRRDVNKYQNRIRILKFDNEIIEEKQNESKI